MVTVHITKLPRCENKIDTAIFIRDATCWCCWTQWPHHFNFARQPLAKILLCRLMSSKENIYKCFYEMNKLKRNIHNTMYKWNHVLRSTHKPGLFSDLTCFWSTHLGCCSINCTLVVEWSDWSRPLINLWSVLQIIWPVSSLKTIYWTQCLCLCETLRHFHFTQSHVVDFWTLEIWCCIGYVELNVLYLQPLRYLYIEYFFV